MTCTLLSWRYFFKIKIYPNTISSLPNSYWRQNSKYPRLQPSLVISCCSSTLVLTCHMCIVFYSACPAKCWTALYWLQTVVVTRFPIFSLNFLICGLKLQTVLENKSCSVWLEWTCYCCVKHDPYIGSKQVTQSPKQTHSSTSSVPPVYSKHLYMVFVMCTVVEKNNKTKCILIPHGVSVEQLSGNCPNPRSPLL